tara:strand:- start:454 stop:1212 length:759 start_codon:yes stop_codon:yes gene_type:complete
MESLIRNFDYDVYIAFEPPTPVVGEETTITFHVQQDGEYSDVFGKNSQVMHTTITSDNLQDFAHIAFGGELEQKEIGVYQFTHTFTQPDHYGIWIDFPDLVTRDHHGDRLMHRVFYEFTIPGGPAGPQPEEIREVVIEPFRITLSSKDDLMATDLEAYHFDIERTDGKPTGFLFGADQYYVIAAPALDEYRLFHVDHHLDEENRVGTEITALNKPGKYIVWIELYVHGDDDVYVLMPTFVIDIPPYVPSALR